MAYQLFQLPKQVLHSGGALKASWKVQFAYTGLSTQAPVYTSSALSVQHSQPVQADSAGVLAAIYLDPSITYKASVYDQNDVLQYTVDPVNDAVLSQASIGALLYPRTAAEISTGVTPTNYAYPPGDVRRYGAACDGTTDDTAAFNAAITAGLAGTGFVELPAGDIKVTSQLTAISGQLTVFGQGQFKSAILFAPSANGSCMKLSNGASQVTHVTVRDLGFKSTDSTYTKTALDLSDISMCNFERIYIRGTGGAGPGAGAMWSGSSSIGVRTRGRDQVRFDGITIFADRPILISANPNTTATECEEIDHWNFANCYLIANANPIVEVESGLGIQDLTFNGFQAWVGGAGGFKMNDTRAAPTVPSHGISFENIRTEQQTDATKYAFDIAATFPIQQIRFNNLLIGNGSHGFNVNAADHIRFANCSTAVAAGKDSVNLTAANSRATLVIESCYWNVQTSNFTLSGYEQTSALAGISGAPDYAGPSSATYVATGGRVATQSYVARSISRRATITYSTSMTPDASLGVRHRITATNGTAFTINAPTSGVVDQELEITIRNTSGGALGAVTWNGNYKMSAWTQPANGFSRSIRFVLDLDGTSWVQVSQTGVDVAN